MWLPTTPIVAYTRESFHNYRDSAPAHPSNSTAGNFPPGKEHTRRKILRALYCRDCRYRGKGMSNKQKGKAWSTTNNLSLTIQSYTARSWWPTMPPRGSSRGNNSSNEEWPSTKEEKLPMTLNFCLRVPWQTCLATASSHFLKQGRFLHYCNIASSNWQSVSPIDWQHIHRDKPNIGHISVRGIMGSWWKVY